jgi:hypothetical protein
VLNLKLIANRIKEEARGEKMTLRARGMRIGGLVAGIILVVLGALMLAEGIITLMGNPAFIFIDNMNRAFELVVGLVTIIVAGSTMDISRA